MQAVATFQTGRVASVRSEVSWAERGLDVPRLQESSGCDHNFEKELLDIYIRSCETHLRTAEETLCKGDRKESHLHIHSIKGTSLQLGAPDVARLCKEVGFFVVENDF
jgi:HPt (histidine-containing phosphotransfer) domain-containing protein